VITGIETDRDRGSRRWWRPGYAVHPVNPLQAPVPAAARVSGAKNDGRDARILADVVRSDSDPLHQAAGDSPQAERIKGAARTHKTLIWDRTRQVHQLRHDSAGSGHKNPAEQAILRPTATTTNSHRPAE
jgi:transposase